MKRILNRFRSSQLLSVSFFSAIATFFRLLVSFLSAKVISLYLGPEGLGLLGQLSSFTAIVLMLSTGAINNGVIKYVAEYNNEGDTFKLEKILKTSLSITLICSMITGLALVLFAPYWSSLIFAKTTYSSIIFVFGFTLVFYALFNLFLSVLNGLKEYKKYNYISIIASAIGFVFSLSLIKVYGLYGALLSTVTYQSVVFLLLLFVMKGTKIPALIPLLKVKATSEEYKLLFHFSMMAVVTTATSPVAQIYIRNFLHLHVDMVTVGYYEAVNRISAIPLTLITTTLSVYYLPRLSEIRDTSMLKKEIIKGYTIILPLTSLILVLIFVFRHLIIGWVFAPSFEGMKGYFQPQLIGDFFKIASWLLAFQMLAKAMTMTYIITEIAFSLSLVLMSTFLINRYGGIGAVYAYAINYFFYFLTMVCIFRKVFWGNKNGQL